ncbi:MAG: hypothetical protein GEV04_03915 [Actinophytocola sp.]|nr:hypothetical protein [Actinophytocola sp.]
MPTAQDRELLANAARVNADAGAALVSMLDELEDGELRMDALREVAIRLSEVAATLRRRTDGLAYPAEAPPTPRAPQQRLASHVAP